jgi:arylsulfatase A-like enzyme
VWAPGEVFAGQRRSELCQLFDLGATMLDWAGAPLSPACQAQSLLPALRGEPWAGREQVFAEQAGDVVLTGARLFSMVRDARWKLVHVLDSEDGQLFDVKRDPGEIDNLWNVPEQRPRRERMLQALLEWRMRSSVETMNVMQDGR